MRRLNCAALAASLGVMAGAAAAAAAPQPGEARMVLPAIGLHFEPNRGQGPAGVDFIARAPGYALGLQRARAWLHLRDNASGQEAQLAAELLGAAADNATPEAEQALPGQSHYYGGGDPARWQAAVPHYGRVRYRGVYPGTDLVYYGQGQQLEYDFELAPGADPSRLRLLYRGVQAAEATPEGDLLLRVDGHALRLQAPVSYQTVDGERRPVASRYRSQVTDDGVEVAFELGTYDRGRALVIDPVLAYSSYFGGSGYESAGDLGGIARDAEGNLYIVGKTLSANFPVVNAVQPKIGDTVFAGTYIGDAFIAKLSPDGSRLLYATYLGGNDADFARGVAVNSHGEAVVVGMTYSDNFPVLNAQQPKRAGSWDGFYARLSPAGELLNATYLGGSDADYLTDIAVDAADKVFIGGWTYSTDLPTRNPLQAQRGGDPANTALSDFALMKLEPTGELLFSTYLGGAGNETGGTVAVGADGSVWLAGSTASTGMPTPGGPQPASAGGTDGYLARISSDGSHVLWGSYYGGSGPDMIVRAFVEPSGRVTFTGLTSSQDLPMVNAFDSHYSAAPNYAEGFFATYGPDGRLVQSSYLGGKLGATGYSALRQSGGQIAVFGYTGSPDFPVKNAIQGQPGGGGDLFVARFSPDGKTMLDSTFLGGGAYEEPAQMIVGPDDSLYLYGETSSANFPLAAPLQSAFAGSQDVVIARLLPSTAPPLPAVHFASARYLTREGRGALRVDVKLDAPATNDVRVRVTSVDGSARAGADFLPVDHELRWKAGEAGVRSLRVQLVDDTVAEPRKSFQLQLAVFSGNADAGSPALTTVTLEDDD